MSKKIPIWQMVKEAVEQSNNKVVSNKEIKDYIINKYGSMNKTTINCQILICTVNAPQSYTMLTKISGLVVHYVVRGY